MKKTDRIRTVAAHTAIVAAADTAKTQLVEITGGDIDVQVDRSTLVRYARALFDVKASVNGVTFKKEGLTADELAIFLKGVDLAHALYYAAREEPASVPMVIDADTAEVIEPATENQDPENTETPTETQGTESNTETQAPQETPETNELPGAAGGETKSERRRRRRAEVKASEENAGTETAPEEQQQAA